MAEKFIQSAIKHEGRVRQALGLKEGEKVSASALDSLVARLKKSGKYNKSWAGAIGLARRFIGGDLKQ